MTAIKVIFVLVITAFLIMLVGFGISAFYQRPAPPEYNCYYSEMTPELKELPAPEPGTPEYEEWQLKQQECQEEYNRRWEIYNDSLENHSRNVFFISYPCGLLFITLGLILRPRLDVIKHGLLLGGMGTIIYAIAQSNLANEFRFIGTAIGLAILLYVGYKTLLGREPASKGEGNS